MINKWKVDRPEEFTVEKKTPGFETLKIISGLAELERIVGLVVECGIFSKSSVCVVEGATHGGYIPVNIARYFKQVICKNNSTHAMLQNIKDAGICNITSATDSFGITGDILIELYTSGATGEPSVTIRRSVAPWAPAVKKIKLQRANDWHIVVAEPLVPEFNKHFNRPVDDISELVWDNLIHFCVMVKNGGPLFEKMLTHSVSSGIIDRWTVLDTGSTDETVAAVKRILGNSGISGKLYEEPFINFRDSRNRCLDLVAADGDRQPPCKYNLMLDDTYHVQGNLRGFLEFVRGDIVASSYSNLVRSNDVEYLSCRVTKAEKNLRYKYTLHEVIQEENNVNVRIPTEFCWIEDVSNSSMMQRTVDRKQYDLQCLFGMLTEEPENPRHLYYIAQTFSIIKDYRKAADFFRLRIEHPVTGFVEERNDALIELTRLEHQYLGVPWDTCLAGYEQYSVLDPKRPDGHYFIGAHYYNNGHMEKAYNYFKKAFVIGFPRELRQYSLRPTISQHFVPLFLSSLAYGRDSMLGVAAAMHFLRESTIATDFEKSLVRDWLSIHQLVSAVKASESKKIVCFVAPGGFGRWDGKSLGVGVGGIGGSETWVIETARCLAGGAGGAAGYEVYVFCDCGGNSIIDGVHYRETSTYLDFAGSHRITHCVISRFSEYIPAALASNGTENVHFIMHDVRPSGNIIPVNAKLRNIFCLSEWHKSLFLSQFPQFAAVTHALNYGVRACEGQRSTAVPASFIYSSFANRGLSTVLEIWPQIRKKYSNATLSVFCDLENQWALTNHGPEIAVVKKLLADLVCEGVHNYGWVSKPCLREHWARAMVWLYPCRFEETFCHTALEAAASQTLAITNGLAALDETAARERTVRISGTVGIMDCLEKGLDSDGNLSVVGKQLVDANYRWASEKSWENQTKLFEKLINI